MLIAKYTCNVSGVVPIFNNGYEYEINETENNGIYTVEITSETDFSSCGFNGKTQLLTVEYLKVTSKVTSMDNMFNSCNNLTSLDVSNFDTNKVTNMSGMFYGCNNLTSITFGSNFDTNKVTNMSYMFNGCSNLTSLDLSSFNTSEVTYMNNTFNGCSNLTSLDLSNWNTSKVTNMGWMFQGCNNLTSITFGSNFNTSEVTSMSYMFSGCSNLTSLDLSSFNTSEVTYMNYTFNGCSNLTSLDLSNWNNSKVTNMGWMFQCCGNLTSLNLSSFDTNKVTNMVYMFNGCSNLTSLDLSSFNTSEVTTMQSMFNGCSNLTSITFGSNFDTNKVTNMSNMFNGCSNLTSLDVSNFNTNEVTNMSNMFANCKNLTSLDVSSFNTSEVTYMNNTFNGCTNLTSLDLSSFNTSEVTTMQTMFNSCKNLTSLDVSGFDTSKVTNMEYMFNSCSNLTSLDLSSFDTNKVTNMVYMFGNCNKLTSLGLIYADINTINKLPTPSISTIYIDANIDQTAYTGSSKLEVYEQRTVTINIPTALRSNEEIADRIYWNDEDKHYYIEQNINPDTNETLETPNIIASGVKQPIYLKIYENVLSVGIQNIDASYMSINVPFFEIPTDYEYKWEDELDYIKQSFELRFPDEEDVPNGWGFMGVDGEEGTGLKALIDWVDNCKDEEFVRDFDQHFHRDYTLRYFLLVITLGMVDNLGKNMMLDTWDNKIFMPRFYDCDTICSYDNSGQLKFDVDIEMAQGYWNTSSSRLWTRIRDLMHDELVAKYNNMRQNGLSYESLMECFYDEQIAKIPQKYYNQDYDVKYAPFADSYIGMANGDTYEHLKRWLQQRLRFVDSLYDYAPSYNNDVLTIRANTTEPMTLEIETYTPVYQHLSWYNNQMDKKKIDGKTSVTFTGKAMAETDQEVLIYGGSNIKSIKGITSMNPNRMLIGSATRLIELDAPNCPLLADINANKANLAPHVYLNKVNLSGCPLLGGNLIVNQSPLIREIDIRNTAITGLNLSSNLRNLEVLKLPATIPNLVLNDASQLHTLEFDEGGTLQNVSMTNCNALTNVANFDLSNAQQVTLNNSYNVVNELYFSKTTNLSVSNMSNLERVVYIPNAEHEVFDKVNVDNASNYTVSTFNCPKLTTFMTTASYRDSYNNCEIIDIPYTEPCYQTVLEAYNPNGEKFKHTLSDCAFNKDNGVEIEIDVSSCIGIDENIISIGVTSIDYFRTAGTYHFYYNAQNRLLQMFNGSANTSTRITLKDNENIVHIKFNKSGLFINDICYASYSYDDSINTILVGSEEGLNRSNATINHLRYCTEMLNTVIQAKDYGEVKPNEVFEANTIDISNTQFTDVKLLCTTDTNVLKLPQTVKNLIVDSAYDLDTKYLTDGDHDTIHTELYEPYNTDYEGSVFKKVTTYYPDFFGTEMSLTEGKYIDTDGSISDADNWYATVEFYDISHYTSIRLNSDPTVTRIFFYDSSQKFIIFYEMNKGEVIDIPNNAKYARWLVNNFGLKRDITINSKSPMNIVPTASDGSIIQSMYAPSNTVQPASGVWDLKGFVFDNYHIFGLNNDVKLVDDTLTMPNRIDDYSVEIVNKNIKGTVAIYTASDNTTFPTFNNGFEYTSSITPKDGVYEYTLVAKDEDNLPTSISFNDKSELLTVEYLNVTSKVTNMNGMFYGCNNLTSLDVSGFDTSKVTNMSNMFANCSNLTSITFGSNFNTSEVTTMSNMFANCKNLTSLDVSNFDTKNVTDMSYMFHGCTKLTSLDISNFDTSKVTAMSNMFANCSNLTSLDLSNFDTSKVTNMNNMFYNCQALTSLDLSNWDTKNVITMAYMFNGCTNLTSLDLSNFDTSKVTSMNGMFNGCNKLTSLDVSNFDTSEVTSMANMFQGCTNLTSLDVSNFDTKNVTTIAYMFHGCNKLTSLDLSNFDTNKVNAMTNMFYGCTNLTSLDVCNFDTSKVTGMYFMFNGCSNLISLDLSNFDTSEVTTMVGMFQNCTSLQELHIETWPLNDVTQKAVSTLPVGNDAKNMVYATVYFTVPSGWTLYNALEIARYTCNTSGVLPTFNTEYTGYSTQETENEGIYTVRIATDSIDNLPTQISFSDKSNLLTVEYLNVDNVTNMKFMFQSCSNLTSLDLSNFDTSNVTDMYGMFTDCNSLTLLDVSNFDTKNVTSMESVFYGCTNLTSLDVSNFDTSKVTSMQNMFRDCNKLTSITFGSNFNTSKVTNMNNAFFNCANLTSLDLSHFDTQNVTLMGGMFFGCNSLTLLDVSNWDTSEVINMESMFLNCRNLTSLDVSGFDTRNVTTMKNMFLNCNNLTSLDLSNFDTSKVTDTKDMFFGCRSLTSLDSMQNIPISLSLDSTILDQTSLVDVINNLKTVITTQTLTLGTTLLAKLTEDQIAVAVNKGWTVA